MKNLFLGLFLLSSFSTFAESKVVATIAERGSSREIVISQEVNGLNQDVVYTLKDRAMTQELNRISYSEHEDAVEASGKYKTYKFNLFKAGLKASGGLYNWCWVENALVDDTDFGPIVPTISTIAGGVLGFAIFAATGGTVLVVPVAIAGAGLAFCTAGAAVPAVVLSAALLPVDAIISGASHFSAKATANRKLEKALDGNDKKASKTVFNLILKKVRSL